MTGEEGEESRGPWWMKPTVIVPLLVALIGAAAGIVRVIIQDGSPLPPPAGQILSPESGHGLASTFTVEGTLSAIPGDHHVWIAVQIGNLLFPKEPEIPPQDEHWVQKVVEAGQPGTRFSLVLLMVDASGQRVIEDWLARGRTGGGYAGFANVSGSVRLDAVTGLVVSLR